MSIPPIIQRIPREAWIWALALVGLAIVGPSLEGHLSFCVPSMLGFDFCLGCGLGRSISQAMHGNVQASWAAHPLGIITLGVLIGRIITLVYHSRTINN